MLARALSLLGALLAALLATLALGNPAIAAAQGSPESIRAYAYDSRHSAADFADDSAERGPPVWGYDANALMSNAVDCWSHGPSSSSGLGAWPAVCTYNAPARLLCSMS